MARDPERRDRVVTLIAVFKFVKAALLVAAGVGLFELVRPGAAAHASRWLNGVAGPERHALHALLAKTTGRGSRTARLAGIGAFAYAALFLTEGTGLWLRRRWAEYLTVFATGSLIPFEVWELARRFTAPKLVGLILNVAVVAYLAWRLRVRRRGEHAAAARAR